MAVIEGGQTHTIWIRLRNLSASLQNVPCVANQRLNGAQDVRLSGTVQGNVFVMCSSRKYSYPLGHPKQGHWKFQGGGRSQVVGVSNQKPSGGRWCGYNYCLLERFTGFVQVLEVLQFCSAISQSWKTSEFFWQILKSPGNLNMNSKTGYFQKKIWENIEYIFLLTKFPKGHGTLSHATSRCSRHAKITSLATICRKQVVGLIYTKQFVS